MCSFHYVSDISAYTEVLYHPNSVVFLYSDGGEWLFISFLPQDGLLTNQKAWNRQLWENTIKIWIPAHVVLQSDGENWAKPLTVEKM